MKLILGVFVVLSLTSSNCQPAISDSVLEVVSLLTNSTQFQNTVPNSNLFSLYQKYIYAKQSLKELWKIDSVCSKQIFSVIEGIDRNELWALQMMDATAKLPAGVLFGNILSLGNYEECTEIHHYDGNLKTDIKGQYCSAVVTLGKSTVDFDMLAETDNLVEAADEFDFTNVRMIFGLCVPSGCNSRDLQNISNAIFPDLAPIRMTFMEKFCSLGDTEKELPTRSIIGLCIFCSFGILLIFGTLADLLDPTDNNAILRCFSMYSNGKKLFSSKTGEDSLLCLNGLRVLSMMLIILGHRFIMTNGMPAVNKIAIERWKESLENYIFIGLGFAVDTFFTISGLLVVYLCMKAHEKGQSIQWGMFYLHRILRLSPSLIMIVLFYATMVNFIQHEPFAIVDDYVGQPCRDYWWTTILYIENYWNPNNMCAVHTWYLAIDTQLYILSPLIIIGLRKFPKKTILIMVSIILLSICAAFEVTWQKKLGATFLNQNPLEYKNLYTPTHIRVPPWLLGAITGYLIAKYKGQKLNLDKISVLILWIISVGSLLFILLIQKAYHDNDYNVWYSAIYNSLARPLWGAAVCMIIVLCVFGKGGIVNSLLSCSLFNVLIRMNYAVYLIHMMVSVSILAKIRTPIFLSNFTVIHEALGDYFIVLLIAIFWTLAFESPIIALEKILFPRDERCKNKLPLDKNNSDLSGGSCETIILMKVPFKINRKHFTKHLPAMQLNIAIFYVSFYFCINNFGNVESSKYFKHTVNILTRKLESVVDESLINTECGKDLKLLIHDLIKRKKWAIQMIDASAKIGSGLLVGNIHQVGNFDECLDIRVEIDKRMITGQYCSILISPKNSSEVSSEFRAFYDPLHIASYVSKKAIKFLRRNVNFLKMSYGICLPSSCSLDNIQTLWEYIEMSLSPPFEIQFNDLLCDYKDKPRFSFGVERYILMAFAFYFCLLLGATVYDIFYFGGDELSLSSYVCTFSLKRNAQKLFSTQLGEDNISCINGLKVLSMFWVLLGHRVMVNALLPNVNSLFIFEWKDNMENMAILGATVSVDSFLTISGLLLSYIYLRYTEIKNIRVNMISFYMLRICRLTPPLLATILTYIAVLKFLTDGPIWLAFSTKMAFNCLVYGWMNILYVNNFLSLKDQCISQSWYLSVDSQLYFLFPLIFFSIKRYPTKTFYWMFIIGILSSLTTIFITVHYGYNFIMDFRYVNTIYQSTFLRMPVWLIGVTTGYFVFKYKDQEVPIKRHIKTLLWISSFIILNGIVFGQVFLMRNENKSIFSALFNAFGRPLWALMICWIIFACVTKNGGVLNTMLSLPIFNFLAKLTYSLFLVHLLVIFVISGRRRHTDHFSNIRAIHEFCGDAIFSLIVGTCFSLLFESPIITLAKKVFRRFEQLTEEKEVSVVEAIIRYKMWFLPVDVYTHSKVE
ncbi:uncharacterized protein LOC123310390 [Coccinella septempunctata]|uniref:uncharacterized protein LOC123310390 n=1 Tax=Coccinella septempunctata TaxID=41139 RepID=UPI001D075BE1|nr:uncharacterized protein LOC123310390 [Coccinella septempunctata]